MSRCKDYWCEFYMASNGACDKCIKKEEAIDQAELMILLKLRALEQMKQEVKEEDKGQER